MALVESRALKVGIMQAWIALPINRSACVAFCQWRGGEHAQRVYPIPVGGMGAIGRRDCHVQG